MIERSRPGRLLLVLASAILFGLSFPPVSLRPLAWIALAPFFVAVRRCETQEALAWGGLWGLAAAYAIGDWMPHAIQTYYLQPAWVGWVMFVAVSGLTGSMYYMAFVVLYHRLAGWSRGSTTLLAAAAWVAAELGRGRLFTGSAFLIGNPWGQIGYSQVGSPVLIQVASLAGVYGISFAIAATNAALAELWLARGARSSWTAAAVGALPLLALLVHGTATLSRADRAMSEPSESVALVQGNVRLASRWRREFYGRDLETYLELTRRLAESADAPVVFWPESAMTFFLESEPLYRRSIQTVMGPTDVHLVAGAPRRVVSGASAAYFNSIYSIAPSGEIVDRYDKEYLVPFAEFFPLRSVELLRRRFEGARTFSPGDGTEPLDTPVGPAAVAVCNEAMLPEVVARRVSRGAAFILNPSNDTWIPEARFAEQQLEIVVLRAVEQRRALVRVSTSGPSALVDPWGRIQMRTPVGEPATLTGRIARRSDLTVYARVGDAFALSCAGAALMGALVGRLEARRRADHPAAGTAAPP